MPIKLGFLGFGEVGYFMSKGLTDEGLSPILGYDKIVAHRGITADNISSRAMKSGVRLCQTLQEMLFEIDVLIAAVPAKLAFSAAEEVLSHDSHIKLYVDVSTAKPSVKAHLEKLFVDKGIKYTDSAMLGPLPNHGHKVPILASGNGALDWATIMAPWGMEIQITEGPAGAASSIKLVRSVFMKGLEALLVETFLFARKSGTEDIVLKSLAETLKVSFEHTANRMMAADLVHAERRVFEIGESIELMDALGVEPIMARAIIERLKKSAALGTRDELGGVPPNSLSEVYRIWREKEYR